MAVVSAVVARLAVARTFAPDANLPVVSGHHEGWTPLDLLRQSQVDHAFVGRVQRNFGLRASGLHRGRWEDFGGQPWGGSDWGGSDWGSEQSWWGGRWW